MATRGSRARSEGRRLALLWCPPSAGGRVAVQHGAGATLRTYYPANSLRAPTRRMNPNTNAWNRIRYGLYAPAYDIVARRLVAGRRRSIEMLDLRPGERVLVVGCGTGLDFELLPPGLRVTAGDLSPAMVRKAGARARALGIDAEVRELDAHALGLPSDHFDAVLLHLILAVVPDPHAAILEAARVLKPGGRAGVFDKFLPDGGRPSLLRRAAGAVTNVIATDINRQLGPLVEGAGLVLERREPAMLGGLFVAALARKPAGV